MGSIIQGQEIGNIQGVTRQAPQMGKVDTSASTLASIFAGVASGVKQYQDENKERLIALGANDQLTGATREVNLLDTKNYETGREYQRIASMQAQSKQEYQNQITDMVKRGANYDELQGVQRNYLDTVVNSIHESTLDSKLKTKLYEDNLANQLVYTKMIGDAIKTQNQSNEAETSLTNSAVLHQTLSTQELQPEQSGTLIASFINNSKESKINAGYTPKEAKTMATRELQGVMQHWINSVDPTAQDGVQALNRYNRVRGLLENSGQIDMDTLTALDNSYNSKKQLLTSHNENVFSIETNNDNTAFALGGKTLDKNWVQSKLAQLNQGYDQGLYSENYVVSQGAKIQGITEAEMKKQAEGKIDPMELANSGMTLSDFSAKTGKSESAYSEYLQRSIENTVPNDLFTQGMTMIDKGIKGDANSQSLPSLLKNGVVKVASTFDNYILSPNNVVTNDESFAERDKNFTALRDQYLQLRAENSPQATALLSSLDSRTAGIITQVFESHGTLGDAINMAKSPVSIEQKSSNVTTAISGLTVESLGQDQVAQSWRSTVSTGSWTSGGGQDLRPEVVALAKARFSSSQSDLIPYMSSGSPNALMGGAKALGMVVESPNGHNPAYFDSGMGKWVKNFEYKGVQLNGTNVYSGKATDSLRNKTAEQFRVSPDNVLITNEGNMIVARPYDKSTGTLAQGVINGRSVTNGVAYTKDEFAKMMRDAYDKDSATVKSKIQALPVEGGTGTFNYNKGAWLGTTSLNSVGGRSQLVNTPSGILVGTNGNTMVASSIMALRNRFEGYAQGGSVAKGQGTSSTGSVIGWGIRADIHPRTYADMKANANDISKQMKIQADFDSGYYKKLPTFGSKVGIPVLDQKLPVKFNNSYELMADFMWHGGVGSVVGGRNITNTLVSAMNQPTYEQGLKILKQTHPYRATNNPETDRRSKYYRQALRSHYDAMGRP